MHGKPGYEQVEVNADKRVLRSIKREAATPGSNLYLSIDARLQKIAEDAFAGSFHIDEGYAQMERSYAVSRCLPARQRIKI